MTRKTGLILLVCLLAALSIPLFSARGAQSAPAFTMTIIHSNDQHSYHEMQKDGSGGGDARAMTVIKQIRGEAKNSLLLDAGDRFTGTLFHKYYLGQDNIDAMNLLGYQAMTLGNHEFDNGDATLAKFIDGLKFPVVSANIDFKDSKLLAGKVKPYVILEVGGQKIGIIGLTLGDTPEISSPGKDVKFTLDYAAVVQPIVDKLSADGVNKIILLTHIGYLVDLKTAEQLSGVDVIVGGHSHTVMGNTIAGAPKYPSKATSKSGEPVYIVQAGSYNRFLGRLNLEFDDKGIVTKADGDTINLLRSIAPDPEVESFVTKLAIPIIDLQTRVIQTAKGETVTNTAAMGTLCREKECELGSLVADAMRWETKVQIAIMNGGGIRAPLNAGPIKIGDAIAVLPFGNTVATFELKGEDVWAALENGVSRVGADSGSGRFPQVSGLRYTYEPGKPVGSRIVSVEVQEADGSFKALDKDKIYKVVANDFMRGGGDGYSVLNQKAAHPNDFGRPLDQVFVDYIATLGMVTGKLDGRITVK